MLTSVSLWASSRLPFCKYRSSFRVPVFFLSCRILTILCRRLYFGWMIVLSVLRSAGEWYVHRQFALFVVREFIGIFALQQLHTRSDRGYGSLSVWFVDSAVRWQRNGAVGYRNSCFWGGFCCRFLSFCGFTIRSVARVAASRHGGSPLRLSPGSLLRRQRSLYSERVHAV